MAKLTAPVIRNSESMGRAGVASVQRKAGAVSGLGTAQRAAVDHLAKVGQDFIERKETEESTNAQTNYELDRDAWILENSVKDTFTADEVRGKVPEGSVNLTETVSGENNEEIEVDRDAIPAHEVYPYMLKNKLAALSSVGSKGITNQISRNQFVRITSEDGAKQTMYAGLEAAKTQKIYIQERVVQDVNNLIDVGNMPLAIKRANEIEGSPAFVEDFLKGTMRRVEWAEDGRIIATSDIKSIQNRINQLVSERYHNGKDEEPADGTKPSRTHYSDDASAGGAYKQYNRNAAIKRLNHALETETGRRGKLNIYEYQQGLASLESGGDSGGIDNKWIDSQDTWTAEEKRVKKLKLDDAMKASVYFHEYKMTSGADDMAAMADIKAMPDGQDYFEKRAAQRAMKTVVTRKQAEVKQDRAAYVSRSDELTGNARQKMIDARGTLGWEKARDEYASYQYANQTKLGSMYLDRVYLLETAEVNTIKADLAGTEENPIAADMVANKLEVLGKEWGDHFPVIHDQLVQMKAITPAQSVAASQNLSNRALTIEVLRSENVKESEYERDIANYKTAVAGFESQAKEALVEFEATFRGPNFDLPGGREEYEKYYDAVVGVLKYRASRNEGVAPDDAQAVADSLLNNKYKYRGTMRIPADRDDSEIAASAHVMKTLPMLEGKQFYLGTSFLEDDDLQAQAKDTLWKEGIWVTNANETGMELLWPTKGSALEGQKVLTINEKGEKVPFMFTWDEFELHAVEYREEVEFFLDYDEAESMGGTGMVPEFGVGKPMPKPKATGPALKTKASGNAL